MKKLEMNQMEQIQGEGWGWSCGIAILGGALATVSLAGITVGTGGSGTLVAVAIASKLISYYGIYDSCS